MLPSCCMLHLGRCTTTAAIPHVLSALLPEPMLPTYRCPPHRPSDTYLSEQVLLLGGQRLGNSRHLRVARHDVLPLLLRCCWCCCVAALPILCLRRQWHRQPSSATGDTPLHGCEDDATAISPRSASHTCTVSSAYPCRVRTRLPPARSAVDGLPLARHTHRHALTCLL